MMLRVLGTLASSLLVLAACGGGAAPSAAPATSAAAAAPPKEITMQSFALSSKTLEVPVGTKVTWTNKDSAQHTATSGAPSAKDGKFDSGSLAKDASFSFTFTTAGTFAYFCTVHPTSAGLQGTITVK